MGLLINSLKSVYNKYNDRHCSSSGGRFLCLATKELDAFLLRFYTLFFVKVLPMGTGRAGRTRRNSYSGIMFFDFYPSLRR